MNLQEAAVYWIHLPGHSEPLTEGYVGVSKNAGKRFVSHLNEIRSGTHSNKHMIHAAKKYGLDNLVVDLLLSGEEAFCYWYEAQLRPTRAIGWNIAPGGHRGPGRNKGSPGKKRTPEEQAQYEVEKQARKLANLEKERKKREEEKIERQRIKKEHDRVKREKADQDKQHRLAIRQERRIRRAPNKNNKPTAKQTKMERHRHNIMIREQEIIVEREKFSDQNPTTRHNAKMRVWELEMQISRYKSWLK